MSIKNFATFALKKHPILSSILGLIIVALIVFAVSFFVKFTDVRGGKHPEDLEPWMSPKFIGHHWNLPREEVFDVLGWDIDADPKMHPRTIGEIAQEQGVTLEDLDAKFDALRDQKLAKP